MPKLTLRLSDDARAGFDRIAEHHGVSITALAEAWGRHFYKQTSDVAGDVVELARQIDAERRTRR